MKKILAIGNSFSQDATEFLHDIALAGGIDTKIVNLYIGGCALVRHWENVVSGADAYEYELNGKATGQMISIKKALLEEDWDVITLQQASHFSGLFDTYLPYLTDLSDYVKSHRPAAKQIIHRTWAYEIDSDHEGFASYDNSQAKMYKALKQAYNKAAEVTGLSLIPCGDVIQTLRAKKEFDYKNGGLSLCRDGFHMDLKLGRYATAATWYEVILGGNILENDFIPPDITKEQADLLDLVKQTVHEICNKKTLI